MSNVSTQINQMIARAGRAAAAFEGFSQLEVDRIVAAMTRAGVANERKLAELAVEETGIGNVEDKVVKNHFGTQVVYDYMRGKARSASSRKKKASSPLPSRSALSQRSLR